MLFRVSWTNWRAVVPKSFQQNMPTLFYTFIGLQLSGAIGMSLIFLTVVFSSLVKRCSTWYTFCVSWILSCFSYSLLFFVGGSDPSHVPNQNLCITQAALIYSVPTLWVTSCAISCASWFPFDSAPHSLRFHFWSMHVLQDSWLDPSLRQASAELV